MASTGGDHELKKISSVTIPKVEVIRESLKKKLSWYFARAGGVYMVGFLSTLMFLWTRNLLVDFGDTFLGFFVARLVYELAQRLW